MTRIVRRTYRGVGWRQKPVEAWNANDLAGYFSEQVTRRWSGTGPGLTNMPALRGQFARWRREDGIGPLLLRTMIDQFVNDERAMSFGDSAWRSFINRRQRFYDAAMRTLGEQERETRSGDAEFWLGIEETPTETPINWTGDNS